MKIRVANKSDAQIIFDLILELATYEKLADEVCTSVETLEEWIFEKKKANVLIGEVDGKVVGYCLYFYNFSTFLGKAGIYIEDLYVRKAYRHNGYGKMFFKQIARIALEEDCGRIDWSCLKWNTPSIDFYTSMGAIAQDEWVGFRLDSEAIKKIAK